LPCEPPVHPSRLSGHIIPPVIALMRRDGYIPIFLYKTDGKGNWEGMALTEWEGAIEGTISH